MTGPTTPTYITTSQNSKIPVKYFGVEPELLIPPPTPNAEHGLYPAEPDLLMAQFDINEYGYYSTSSKSRRRSSLPTIINIFIMIISIANHYRHCYYHRYHHCYHHCYHHY